MVYKVSGKDLGIDGRANQYGQDLIDTSVDVDRAVFEYQKRWKNKPDEGPIREDYMLVCVESAITQLMKVRDILKNQDQMMFEFNDD